ncbi:MAG: sulfate transporter [Burkholderiales bacterium]|nr:sulfate transporter [Burkholderiales bacterium]
MTSIPSRAHAPSLSWFAPREWSGAFGDLGTLVPFLLAYVALASVPSVGLLFTFGVALIVSALIYRTPFPVQPMKAIGAVAATNVAAGASLGPEAFALAALLTGVVWLVAGVSGLLQRLSRLVTRPLAFGIVLGLGIALMLEAAKMMSTFWWVSAPALFGTYVLLARRRFPVMALLLLVGVCVGALSAPERFEGLLRASATFTLPAFGLPPLGWAAVSVAAVILVLPQVPLTFGNAILAITEENNRLFPQRPVTESRVAISTGVMNIFAGLFGGVPMCHGAGGMAGHIRFGARTGGAPLILGSLLLLSALFASEVVAAGLALLSLPVLGVILFVTGSQLALGVCDGWGKKDERFVLLVTAALAVWNVGVAFLAGMAFQWLIRRKLVEL